MKRYPLPSVQRLKELFDYDRRGFFVRKTGGFAVRKGQRAGSTKRKDGYCQMRVDGTKFLTHRLVFLYHNNFCPIHIDHINRKPWDNRIENLRETSYSNNNLNRKKHKNNSSGFRGVYFCNTYKKWKAQVRVEKTTFTATSSLKKDCIQFCEDMKVYYEQN